MIAALLPLRLSDLPAVLPSIMQRLDADTPASMPAQLNDLRASLQSHQLN